MKCLRRKTRSKGKKRRSRQMLETKIFRIFMAFNVVAVLGTTIYSMVHFLYLRQLRRIEEIVRPTILLNVEIGAQTGALIA